MCKKINIFLVLFISLSIASHSLAETINDKLAALEKSTNGQLGISALNSSDHKIIAYRAEQTFPTGSTFKIFPIAAILKQSVDSPSILQERVMYTKDDLASWAPVTEKHLDHGMTVFELSEAAIRYSDSTATELLIKKFGGNEFVVAFAQAIGNHTFNMNSPGAFSYTSTPDSMRQSLQELALGDTLPKEQQQLLITWLKNNTTGNKRIRAGVPSGWSVADKTGSGDYGVTNDIAIIWPPSSQPIIVAIYYKHPIKGAAKRPDIIAQATKLILKEFKFN